MPACWEESQPSVAVQTGACEISLLLRGLANVALVVLHPAHSPGSTRVLVLLAALLVLLLPMLLLHVQQNVQYLHMRAWMGMIICEPVSSKLQRYAFVPVTSTDLGDNHTCVRP